MINVNSEPILPATVQPPGPADDVLPPAYTPLNESLHFFSIKDGFIYAAPRIFGGINTSFPRYQLWVEHTRSGKPLLLKIRRLLASESRIAAFGSREIEFDFDTTLYIIENLGAKALRLSSKFGPIEIRGRHQGAVKGYIELQTAGAKASIAERLSFGGSQKFWHITKNANGDSLREENAAKMQKYGYRPSDEINKDLLFLIRKDPRTKEVHWRKPGNQLLAIESDANLLNILEAVDLRTRDLIVTCWCAIKWAEGSVNWKQKSNADSTGKNGFLA